MSGKKSLFGKLLRRGSISATTGSGSGGGQDEESQQPPPQARGPSFPAHPPPLSPTGFEIPVIRADDAGAAIDDSPPDGVQSLSSGGAGVAAASGVCLSEEGSPLSISPDSSAAAASLIATTPASITVTTPAAITTALTSKRRKSSILGGGGPQSPSPSVDRLSVSFSPDLLGGTGGVSDMTATDSSADSKVRFSKSHHHLSAMPLDNDASYLSKDWANFQLRESLFKAAQIYLGMGLNKEAIDVLMGGGEWTKAKKVAKEIEPRLERYVEEKYKDALKSEGKIDQLVNVDVVAALDMYVQRGEWRKCVEMAEKQNARILHKYLALYAAELINNNRILDALKLYVKHGAPAYPQNFNIYSRIATDIFNLPDMNRIEVYKTWAELRDMLHDLTRNLEKSSEVGATRKEEFETLLLITHYYAIRCACLSEKSLDKIAAKLAISLLRHTEIIPADKAYYEAGMAARGVGWENMAFVFLNRYLDLCEIFTKTAKHLNRATEEAIEEGSISNLDNTDFQDTDIPFDIPLPEKLHVNEQQHEELKEWVLSVSMDQRLEQILPTDERMVFEASLITPDSSQKCPPCVISGYPVFKNKIEFKNSNRVVNKDDWNKFLMATKMSQNEECQDVLRFIGDWCGISANMAYSFH